MRSWGAGGTQSNVTGVFLRRHEDTDTHRGGTVGGHGKVAPLPAKERGLRRDQPRGCRIPASGPGSNLPAVQAPRWANSSWPPRTIESSQPSGGRSKGYPQGRASRSSWHLTQPQRTPTVHRSRLAVSLSPLLVAPAVPQSWRDRRGPCPRKSGLIPYHLFPPGARDALAQLHAELMPGTHTTAASQSRGSLCTKGRHFQHANPRPPERGARGRSLGAAGLGRGSR